VNNGVSGVDWPKLYLRGNPSRKFPMSSSLVAEFKAADIELKALPLQLKLTASGQPQRITVEQEQYTARMGEIFEVRARVVCDDGKFGPKSLKPFVEGKQGRHEASNFFDLWWTIPCAAPDTPGPHQLTVCVTDDQLPRRRFDVQVGLPPVVEDLDDDTSLEDLAPIPNPPVSSEGGLAHNSGRNAPTPVAPPGRAIPPKPEVIIEDLKKLDGNIKRLEVVMADAKRDLEADEQKRKDLLDMVRGLVDADGTPAVVKKTLKRVLE